MGSSTSQEFHRVIGIDLGTTYSAVAVYSSHSGLAEIIEDHIDPSNEGKGTTPSVIGQHPLTRKAVVGWWAKRQLRLSLDPRDTIIEIKREMGEEFREETLDKYNARGVYKVGDPVKAYFAGQWLMPQEISAFTLMKMKQIAENEIGEEIRDAVITVPAFFTEKQKRATEEAGLLAGLYPRQIIPEPTAAAICYGVDTLEEERKIYLVYDLGGGTFDVSIISVEEQNVDVIANSGDSRLGGGDFDDAITDWALGQLEQQYGPELIKKPKTRDIVKFYAEQAKIDLSTFEETDLAPLEIDPNKPPVLKLTRADFENLIDPFLRKSLNFIDKAIIAAKEKGVTRDDIDAVLLVGGSTRIPCIKTLILDHLLMSN